MRYQLVPLDNLLKSEKKQLLTKVLTYHVVAGGSLWIMKNGPHNITVKDEAGGVADIAIYDVLQSSGVIHSIDKVLMRN